MANNFKVAFHVYNEMLYRLRYEWLWANSVGGGGTDFEIYDGAQPSNSEVAVSTQNLLATVNVATTDTSNFYVVDEPVNLIPGASVSTVPDPAGWDIIYTPGAATAGTATWARWNDAVNNAYDAGVGTASIELIFPTATFPAGVQISLSSITYRIGV